MELTWNWKRSWDRAKSQCQRNQAGEPSPVRAGVSWHRTLVRHTKTPSPDGTGLTGTMNCELRASNRGLLAALRAISLQRRPGFSEYDSIVYAEDIPSLVSDVSSRAGKTTKMLPTENPWPAMIALICVAIMCFVQWGTRRKSRDLILGLTCLLLGIGCYLLDTFVQTPRELIIQHVKELTSAFQAQDRQKTLGFFSAQAIAERVAVQLALEQVHVGDDLRLTDLSVTFKAADSLATSHFRANASVSLEPPGPGDVGFHPSRWELDWQKEGGNWKIIKVHRLNPITGKEIFFMATN